jgi:hypothetical protein
LAQLFNPSTASFQIQIPFGRPQNMQDYVFGGQQSLDAIITQLMELHNEENKPPAASEETLSNLPRIKYNSSEMGSWLCLM